jgi:hypothetical protein
VCYVRSLTRITNLSPDQTSFTAQTFTSTSPAAKPISRTLFSSTSVATPEVFLGQETQSMPAGESLLDHFKNFFFRSDWLVLGSRTKSSGVRPADPSSQSFNAAFSSALTSRGTSGRATLKPGLIPSFLGKGVPEYPAMSAISQAHSSRAVPAHETASDQPESEWFGSGRRTGNPPEYKPTRTGCGVPLEFR